MSPFSQPPLELTPAVRTPARSRKQVLQAKHPWESMLDALPQLVCQVDNRGHVLRANRTLETWGLGKVTAVRGTPVHDLLHPGCRDGRCNLKENWEQAWRQLQESGGVEFDYRDESPGRSLHLHLCRSDRSHCRGAREAGRRALLIVEDVTRREQAAQILQNDNAQLESLVQERTRQLALTSTRLRDEIEEHLCDRLLCHRGRQDRLLQPAVCGNFRLSAGSGSPPGHAAPVPACDGGGHAGRRRASGPDG